MELTNRQRLYLGLEQVEPSWEQIEIPNSIKPEQATGKHILYFDGDMLRKNITIHNSGSYLEESCHIKTEQHRTMIAPKTSKGKAKRLNGVNLQRCTSEGMYFRYEGGFVTLANYTTQQTYFSSRFAGIPPISEEELQNFLTHWMKDTDETELERIQAFAKAKRRHCRFKEGDFFRFPIDRTHYGYGQILLDVHKMRKEREPFWDILMGRPLVVSVFHVITENPSMDMETLRNLKSCPSQFIMDNRFYYGEYEIIGHGPLSEHTDYPIMYGLSISMKDKDKILFQRGHVYREIPLEGNKVVPGDFRNNGIGWSLNLDKNILAACIETDSNEPYWNQKWGFSQSDLRHPKNKLQLEQVQKQIGI